MHISYYVFPSALKIDVGYGDQRIPFASAGRYEKESPYLRH